MRDILLFFTIINYSINNLPWQILIIKCRGLVITLDQFYLYPFLDSSPAIRHLD